MPSHKSGSAKQKNKPFKGSSKHKAESKNFGLTVTKRIAKMEKPLPRNDRLNKLKQLRDNKMKEKDDYNVVNDSMLRDMFIELKHKMPGAPKIVLLAAFNDAAQPDLIKANLAQILAGSNEDLSNVNMKSGTTEGNVPHEFEYFRMPTSNKISPELKNDNYIFLTCPRNVETFLDYCKIADIVGIVLSCKNADQSSLLLDPFEHAKAFDEVGYAMLGAMKAQGFPTVVGVLQDLEQINSSKQTAVKKIFTRFFESEIGVDEKVVTLNNNDEKSYIHLMRVLQESQLKELEWRECRSYFLAEKLQVNPQTQILEIEGFLKGNYLNPNQLVHITGYGDYPVLQLDILHNPFMPNYRKQKLLEEITSFGFQPDENRLASFQAEEGKMADYSMFPNQDTQGLKKIKETQEDGAPEETKEEEGFEEEVTMGEGNEGKPKMMDEGDEEMIADEQSDISFEENATQTGMLTEEKKELRQLTRRADDEKDFADEVEYPSDIKVRERYRKYKGLKSFKATEWNPYDGLPAEYEKIFIFDDFNKSKKLAVQKAQKEAVAYKGFYVKIYISDFPIDNLANHNKEKPIIVSTLLTHERKISVLNLKVKKQLESEQLLKSKENMEIHLGFRIFNSQPIFSKIISGTTKTKFEKKADKDQVYMASFYGETTYPPANALLFKTNEHGVKQLVASGELMKPDPLRVILKRIIFCGYPFKVHKRTAVVRMMFFNPEDVRNFQHIELTTKNGLRGYIKDSIGTHGYMKCIFSSPAKHSDTVCMNLYKRVFPAWPFEPVQPSVVGTDDLLSHQTH